MAHWRCSWICFDIIWQSSFLLFYHFTFTRVNLMLSWKPKSNIFFLHLFIQKLFCLGLKGSQSETESEETEERALPQCFLLLNKPVKSAVKTFRYFLSCNGQSSDMSRIPNSARLVVLVLVWVCGCFWLGFFCILFFMAAFCLFDYKGKLNWIVHWPHLQF